MFSANHPRKEGGPFCVITFVHPRTGKRVYCRLRGLPIGMGTVVDHCNRLPHLTTAVLTILFGMLTCHDVEDELLLCVGVMATPPSCDPSHQRYVGHHVQPNKTHPFMSVHTNFLGNTYDCVIGEPIWQSPSVSFQPLDDIPHTCYEFVT